MLFAVRYRDAPDEENREPVLEERHERLFALQQREREIERRKDDGGEDEIAAREKRGRFLPVGIREQIIGTAVIKGFDPVG